MLKETRISIAPVLTMLFIHSIQTGKLPSAWKASNMLPIPKESIRTMHLQTNLVVIHLTKLLERIIMIELLPTLNALIHQCRINRGSYPENQPQVIAILSATYDWFTHLE